MSATFSLSYFLSADEDEAVDDCVLKLSSLIEEKVSLESHPEIANCWMIYWETEQAQDSPLQRLSRDEFGLEINAAKQLRSNAYIVFQVTVMNPATESESSRIVIATFGMASRLLDRNLVVREFGLAILMNLSRPGTMSILEKSLAGGKGKTVLEQLHRKGGLSDFIRFFDPYQVRKIGASLKEFSGRSAIGSDQLRVPVEIEMAQIVGVGEIAYAAYLSEYLRDPLFAEIEVYNRTISETEKLTVIQSLFDDIISRNWENIGLTPVPYFDQGNDLVLVKKKYDRKFGGNCVLTNDWDISTVLNVILEACESIDDLLSMRVLEVNDQQKPRGSYNLVEKLITYTTGPKEFVDGIEVRYLLENGFARVPAHLYDYIDEALQDDLYATQLYPFDEQIDRNPKDNKLSEYAYNNRMCEKLKYSLYDEARLRPTIGGSPLEFCDMFDGRVMYCVKRGDSPDKVGYLCDQAVAASYALRFHPERCRSVIEKIDPPLKHSILDVAGRLTISLVIVAQGPSSLATIGLKSKLALMKAKTDILNNGHKFRIEFVDVIRDGR